MDANGLQIEAVAVHWDAGETQYRRLALLTPNDEGSWKVDFDALAETSQPGWDEWQKPGPLEGIMRIGFQEDVYYNGLYHDDSMWACYTVHGADADLAFFAYCKRGSVQHRALEKIMVKHESRLPYMKVLVHVPRAVIAVSRAAGGEKRQLEITRVIAEGLLVGLTPFEETLR